MEIRKWKSPILGVARIVLCDIFLCFVTFFWLLFLLRTWNKNFFHFCAGKFSRAAPPYHRAGRWSGITPCVSSQYKLTLRGTVGTQSHGSDRHPCLFTLRQTMVHCSFDVLFIAFGSITDSCMTSSLERFSLKPDKARGQNLPSALSASLSFV